MSEARGEGHLIADYGLLCEVTTRDEEHKQRETYSPTGKHLHSNGSLDTSLFY